MNWLIVAWVLAAVVWMILLGWAAELRDRDRSLAKRAQQVDESAAAAIQHWHQVIAASEKLDQTAAEAKAKMDAAVREYEGRVQSALDRAPRGIPGGR